MLTKVDNKVTKIVMEKKAVLEKIMTERTPEKCCFCGCDIQGYGHNPAPVRTTGVCCDACNGYVVTSRLDAMERFSKKVG